MDYFHSYAEHFNLYDQIQFNSKVVEIRYIGEENPDHKELWGRNGGPFADSTVWEVGVQNCSNANSIERWMAFKLVEIYLLWKLPLRKYGLVPKHSFLQELSSCQIASLPENLFSRAEEGCILFKKCSNWCFSSKGLVLDDETEVEADVVVLGTGYDGEKKLKGLLPSPFSDALGESAGMVPLYRGLIHPRIPHMAILGYPESLSNLHSSEIRSQWLAHFLAAKFALPSIKEMEAYTDKRVKHMKKITPFYWRSCLATFQIWDNDELCRDMGRSPMRKRNWFHELFSPYSNLDYRED